MQLVFPMCSQSSTKLKHLLSLGRCAGSRNIGTVRHKDKVKVAQMCCLSAYIREKLWNAPLISCLPCTGTQLLRTCQAKPKKRASYSMHPGCLYKARNGTAHCRILLEIRTYFLMSKKSNSMLEFQAHVCWVITVDYKVRLGQVKSEFDWKRPKLTRSVRARNCPYFPLNKTVWL